MANLLMGISTPYININGLIIPHKVGSVEYTEGTGEDMLTAMSAGGGAISPVYSKDVSKNIATFKFVVLTVSLIQLELDLPDLMLSWKKNNPNNIIIVGDTISGFVRAFEKAVLITDYVVKLGPEAETELEFKSANII